MKRIAETLGVAHSNLIERAAGKRRKRGPQTRTGDGELTAEIPRLVDTRPMGTGGSPLALEERGDGDGQQADRHARLQRLIDDRQLLLRREPPPAGNTGDDFYLRKRRGHKRMPRSLSEYFVVVSIRS